MRCKLRTDFASWMYDTLNNIEQTKLDLHTDIHEGDRRTENMQQPSMHEPLTVANKTKFNRQILE